MTAVSALGAVAAGAFAALNQASLQAAAPGGIWDQTPRGTTHPSVQYQLQETEQLGGMSTDAGAVVELELRVHVYSTYEGFAEARVVMDIVMGLLTGPLTLTGFRAIGPPNHQDTAEFPDQVVAGQRVNELVGRWQIFVEKL